MSSPDAARIHTFERESLALVAEEVEEIPEGWVARSRSLPMVWALNHVGVTGAVDYAWALELLERYQHELPYRQLRIEHEPSGERLEAQLRAEGWDVDRNLAMALRREPDRALDTSAVTEAPEPEALGLMWDWTGEDEKLRTDAEAHRQVIEAIRLTWRARNARRLGILGPDGSLAAIAMLFSDGVAAQVEDVYVVPAERGRGFGRALVTRAAILALDADHEFVFILADDAGWPKHLYAQVGFEPAGRSWEFHR